MRTNRINTLVRLCGTTIALAFFAAIAGMANALGNGATRLLWSSGTLVEPNSTRFDYNPMSYARCMDQVLKVKDNLPTKGADGQTLFAGGVPTKRISTDECKRCGDTWVVSSHGKAKTSTAVHTLVSRGPERLACG